MSRSLLNNYLKEMKELGFPIEYDKRRQTYYYKEEGRMTSRFFIHQLNNKEMDRITGGAMLFSQEIIVGKLDFILSDECAVQLY